MNIKFTGRNIEVTPALKTFTEEKMERVNNRHANISSIHVSLIVENVEHIAEATVILNGSDIHSTAKSNDMYTSIDMMIEKLLTQMTKIKEKTIDSHR